MIYQLPYVATLQITSLLLESSPENFYVLIDADIIQYGRDAPCGSIILLMYSILLSYTILKENV